jgi:hypothetical protein
LNAAFYLTAGEEVPLTVSRAGQTMEIKVVPGLNPVTGVVPPPIFSLSVRIGKP